MIGGKLHTDHKVIHRESSLSYLHFMFIVFIIILLTVHKTVAYQQMLYIIHNMDMD